MVCLLTAALEQCGICEAFFVQNVLKDTVF